MSRRSKRFWFLTVSIGGFVAAACGTGPTLVRPVAAPTPLSSAAPAASTTTVTSASAAVVVHAQSAAGITTVAADGRRWSAPSGVATPDWTTIFTTEAGRLRTLDGATGAQRASQPVAAGLRAVVSSPDGLFVALTDSPSRIGQGLLPAGRSRSIIVVAPAAPAGGEMRTFTLDGNLVPEGFSSDHARLFVIEFLPAMHPDRYRVRSLNIATGEVGPVFTYDKTVDTEEMRGTSRTQVFSANGPYGPMLYTLYSRAGGATGYDDVHALSLDGGLVHCTDLPANFRIEAGGGAITVSPDGKRVYVASATGEVVEIDASSSAQQPFPIQRTTSVTPGGATRTVALTADNDTVWLGLGNRVVGLAASDLRQVTTATVEQPVYALATQPDGTLYAATSSTVESILTSTGASHVLATVDSTSTRLGVV